MIEEDKLYHVWEPHYIHKWFEDTYGVRHKNVNTGEYIESILLLHILLAVE